MKKVSIGDIWIHKNDKTLFLVCGFRQIPTAKGTVSTVQLIDLQRNVKTFDFMSDILIDYQIFSDTEKNEKEQKNFE